MFDTLNDTAAFYANPENKDTRHEILYKEFHKNTLLKEPRLAQAFQATEGFGELPFCWNWYLTVQDAPKEFRYLEIGVYKGRVLAEIQYLANIMGKSATIVGVTPLSGSGDKYSGYEDVDYLAAIKESYKRTFDSTFVNTTIIKGYSQDPVSISEAGARGPYDILFIDGCHDYEVVCQDIANYIPLLKKGGVLVMDDASLYIEKPFGQFHGHPDVGRAIKDTLDSRSDMQHLFAVGHNRIWKHVSI